LISKGYHSFDMENRVAGQMQAFTLPSPSKQGGDRGKRPQAGAHEYVPP
jgi:hypothetical protein